MAGNLFFVPNAAEFFESLVSLLQQCELCRQENSDGGLAEFLGRRLEEYQRTLRVMYGRVRESVSGEETELTRDLERLIEVIGRQLESLTTLYSDHDHQIGAEMTSMGEDSTLFIVTRSGNAGRPRYEITQEQIHSLREALGFRWVDIARMLGMSTRTLSRRRQEFGMPLGHHNNFSSLPDEELDNYIRNILLITPQSGVGLVQGALRSRGLRVQRRRVIEALQRLDPVTSVLRQSRRIIRRTYQVPGPNSLWHIDGDHKLIEPYRFVIHGGIDGFSRLVVYLHASTNNRASTVLALFREATNHYNVPSRVRSDRGLENIEVGRFMIQTRGLNRGSIITGNSVHNQRIERLWREVNRVVVSRFLNIFIFLESRQAFDPNDEIHLYALHFVFLPLINAALSELRQQWNNHPVTSESNYSPRQLWTQGMLQLRNSRLSAVRDVVEGEHVNVEEFGIEEEGPVPIVQRNQAVTIPESPIHLSDAEELRLRQEMSAVSLDENGIMSYLIALAVLLRLAQ